MNKECIKTIFNIVVLLIVLQLTRIGIQQIIFMLIERDLYISRIASMIAMILLSLGLVLYSRKEGVLLSVLPKRFSLNYIIATIAAVCLLISTPFITGDTSSFTIFLMVYSSVIVPIFEELIFRDYAWNKLSKVISCEWIVYAISTLMFAVWHIGYIDAIAPRVESGLVNIIAYKVITGLCFGIILGAVRMKTKNSYSTMLLHDTMNIFGR